MGDIASFLIGAGLVSLGAIAGTPLRFFVGRFAGARVGETFPWGTLLVNVSGCLVMGVVAAYAVHFGYSGTSN